jgi:ATP-dependent DNA ligase
LKGLEPRWVKSKCLNREEFVVVGWTDPEGSRSHIGALLLSYYTDDGRLHFAGRAGTGITPLPLIGLPEPLRVHMDFEAKAIDAMIERLGGLRRQLLN